MSAFGDALRQDFETKRSRGPRAAKLARVYAKPEQVERDEHGDIVINPPGEDALDRAQREAMEARKLADEARA
ncbi:MAG: hypothetical protein ACYDHN_01705 [Solirubrobacteraceae bacterium]